MTTAELLGLLATAVAAGGLVSVGLLAVRRRPARPRPATGSSDIPDDPEPPAIVNLVTEGFEVTHAAPAATLLDLAARSHLDIERYSDHTICRLRDRSSGDRELTAYERRLLAHLRAHERNGTVPADALAFGSEGRADRWFRAFAADVIAHAQRLGLCHDRWTWTHVLAVGAIGVVTFVLSWLTGAAADSAPQHANTLQTSELLRTLSTLGGFALFGVAGRMQRSQRQLPDPPGLEIAGRWLGVRSRLAGSEALDDRPAAGVIVWGPHLVYAAAMDLAPEALSDLPLGQDDDEHAWSHVTGRWRHLRIVYPRLRPAWGLHPFRAVARGLVVGGLAVGVAWTVRWLAEGPAELADTLPSEATDVAGTLAAPVTATAGLVVAYAVVVLLAGASDLFATREVRGLVVRRRERSFVPRRLGGIWDRLARDEYGSTPERPGNRRYVAVDDGSDDRLVAWSVTPLIHGKVREGQTVTAHVTPRLGYVRSVQPPDPPGPSA